MDKLNTIKNCTKIYLPVLILSILFLASPLIKFYESGTSIDYLLLSVKLILGFSIVIWLLIRFLIELYQFHKRLLISQMLQNKSLLSYKWIFKKENVWTYSKTIVFIAPFLLFTIYNILRFSNTDVAVLGSYSDLLTNIQSWIPDYVYNFDFVYGQPIFLILATIATGCLFSLILLSLTTVIYKIALSKLLKQVENRLEKIGENLNLKNNLEEITGNNSECIREDNELDLKVFSSKTTNVLEIKINLIYSYLLKETKKATTPPNNCFTG